MTTHATSRRPLKRWPLILIAAPAAVATWSGWVELGRMTGFGEVNLLPGIWDGAVIDTAITLPIGVEAYAAYALNAWMSSRPVAAGTRRFAAVSGMGALAIGASGQVAYHLLEAAGYVRAPWQITAVVACLPVMVLGLAAILRHLITRDAEKQDAPGVTPGAAEPVGPDDTPRGGRTAEEEPEVPASAEVREYAQAVDAEPLPQLGTYRSMDQLRDELRAALAAGSLDRLTADAITAALSVRKTRARELRDWAREQGLTVTERTA